jgi:hypothetical protein
VETAFDTADRKFSLGEWAYQHEDAIVSALKEAVESRSLADITKFERALDSLPKRPK